MGPYEVVAAIRTGGMGEVYRARDTRLGREVAIKLLGARFQTRTDAHERLLREARAVSALNHPNILALYDICSENGNDFLVMELVRGKTLDQLIGNRGLDVREALKYGIPIADAIARAHAAGILHLDLKPSNIMITDDGVPKVLDFGLAHAIEPDSVRDGDETLPITEPTQPVIAGTAAYMSPEQAEGKKAGCALGYFQLRRGPVRNGDRQAGVSRRFDCFDARSSSASRSRGALAHHAADSARARADYSTLFAKGSEPSISNDGRRESRAGGSTRRS